MLECSRQPTDAGDGAAVADDNKEKRVFRTASVRRPPPLKAPSPTKPDGMGGPRSKKRSPTIRKATVKRPPPKAPHPDTLVQKETVPDPDPDPRARAKAAMAEAAREKAVGYCKASGVEF